MSDQENALAKYVEKMYQIQMLEDESILSPQELKTIALDMGISEQEWAESQQVFEGHLKTGEQLVKQRNWDDAIAELDHATSLNPYHIDAVYAHAKALIGRYNESGNMTDEQKARELVRRALKVQPGHEPSIKLLTMLSSGKKVVDKEKKQTKLYKNIAIGLGIAILVLGFISMRGTLAKKDEEVKQAWAQVENVYQRRADLIPSLVNTVKGAAKQEQERLKQITELQAELSGMGMHPNASQEEMSRFSQKQSELGNTIKIVLGNVQSSSSVGATQAFRDLMIQLEGSENRIATERRKFNQAVQDFNSQVRQFPYGWLGYGEKPYFQVDKSAMDKPKVEF